MKMHLGPYGIVTLHEGLDQPYLYKLAGEISENILVWLLVGLGLRVAHFRHETPHFDLIVFDYAKTMFEKGIALISIKSRENRERVRIKTRDFDALKKERLDCESLGMNVYLCLAFYHPRRISEIMYYLFPLHIVEKETNRGLSWNKQKTDRIYEKYFSKGEKVHRISDDFFQPRVLDSKLSLDKKKKE